MDIRAQFPALAGPDVFLDNAGGSQVPRCVADRMRDYLLESYVQLDGEYATSRRSTEAVERAHQFINVLMNGVGCGEVGYIFVLGVVFGAARARHRSVYLTIALHALVNLIATVEILLVDAKL